MMPPYLKPRLSISYIQFEYETMKPCSPYAAQRNTGKLYAFQKHPGFHFVSSGLRLLAVDYLG